MNGTSEWFAGIPQCWPAIPIKHGFRLIGSGTTPPTGESRFYDGTIPWVNTSELRETVVFQTDKTLTTEAIEELTALRAYPVGTVLFAMYGATIGRVAILGVPATVNQAVCALADPSRFTPRFVFYGLQASREFLAASSTGGGQPNLNAEKVREHKLPCPDPQTQRAIADYLDRETARLDALVAAKERLLGLLAEKRRVLITRAVTRGLDLRVPLRDSGIPWLGEIPTHWTVVQLKFASISLQTGPFGSQLHSEDYATGGTPVVNPSHLSAGRIHADDRVAVDDATADRLAIHRLGLGDVVFARRGEMGRCGVVEADNVGWLCGTGSLRARLRLDIADPYYLALVFAETRISDVLTVQSVGSTMDNLNTEILGSCHVPIPPRAEQRAIVNHIASETAKLGELRAASERTIALLKERRAALISAAVTGRIQCLS